MVISDRLASRGRSLRLQADTRWRSQIIAEEFRNAVTREERLRLLGDCATRLPRTAVLVAIFIFEETVCSGEDDDEGGNGVDHFCGVFLDLTHLMPAESLSFRKTDLFIGFVRMSDKLDSDGTYVMSRILASRFSPIPKCLTENQPF